MCHPREHYPASDNHFRVRSIALVQGSGLPPLCVWVCGDVALHVKKSSTAPKEKVGGDIYWLARDLLATESRY